VDPLADRYHSFSSYNYTVNNPIINIDPDGRYFESIVDLAFIGYDIAEMGYDYATTGEVSPVSVAALMADVGCLLAPVATGGGLAVRAAAEAGEEVVERTAREAVEETVEKTVKESSERTSNASRREVMRDQGIPTSQQPESQSKNASGREYTYEVPKTGGGTQKKSVQQQTKDRNHSKDHWEAGTVKTDPRTGKTRYNKHGNPKLKNDKSKVEYEK
jgi:hypothetical protein